MSTYPPVSLTDVYDLIQTLSGGGATTQQILDAINYISRGQTWDLKEVADSINNNNNSLLNGDAGGPSLLFDQIDAQTAAQLLRSIKLMLNGNGAAPVTNSWLQDIFNRANTNTFIYSSLVASLPASSVDNVLNFSTAGGDTLNFYRVEIYNATNRFLEVSGTGTTKTPAPVNVWTEVTSLGVISNPSQFYFNNPNGSAANGTIYLRIFGNIYI